MLIVGPELWSKVVQESFKCGDKIVQNVFQRGLCHIFLYYNKHDTHLLLAVALRRFIVFFCQVFDELTDWISMLETTSDSWPNSQRVNLRVLVECVHFDVNA